MTVSSRSPSFACVNPCPSQNSEVQVLQPLRGPSAQGETTVSLMRQRILEAYEAHNDIPRRKKKKNSTKRNRVEEDEFRLPTPSSERRKRKKSQLFVANDVAPLVPVEKEHSSFEAISQDEQQVFKVDRPALSNLTLYKLGAFKSEESMKQSQNGSGLPEKDMRDLSLPFSRDMQIFEPPSGQTVIDDSNVVEEEDDTWYNIHNQVTADETEVVFDHKSAVEDYGQAGGNVSGEKDLEGVIIPENVSTPDTVGEESESAGSISLDDEFPMDEDILEEATNQAEQHDQQPDRYEENLEVYPRISPLPKRWTVGSQCIESASDSYTNDAISAGMDMSRRSYNRKEPTINFAMYCSTPIMPPSKPPPQQTLSKADASSSSFQENYPSSLYSEPIRPDFPTSPSHGYLTAELRQSNQTNKSYETPSKVSKHRKPRVSSLTAHIFKPLIAASSSTQDPYAPLPPFLRHPFPSPLPLHSPLPSATPNIKLLTCFRTHEILKAISSSSSAQTSSLFVEAYCLVTSSSSRFTAVGQQQQQHFVFADLFFPDTCPLILGVYEGWKGSELYESDVAPFMGLKEGSKMCRIIVTPLPLLQKGRNDEGLVGEMEERGLGMGMGKKARLAVRVRNIWEADWEDVRFVRGIVEAEH